MCCARCSGELVHQVLPWLVLRWVCVPFVVRQWSAGRRRVTLSIRSLTTCPQVRNDPVFTEAAADVVDLSVTGVDHVVALATPDPVPARAAVEDIGVRSSLEGVSATATTEVVGAGSADQAVAGKAPDQAVVATQTKQPVTGRLPLRVSAPGVPVRGFAHAPWVRVTDTWSCCSAVPAWFEAAMVSDLVPIRPVGVPVTVAVPSPWLEKARPAGSSPPPSAGASGGGPRTW